MRLFFSIAMVAMLVSTGLDASAAEPTTVHPAKVSIKGWSLNVGVVSPFRLTTKTLAQILKGAADIPKNELLVLRIPCGAELQAGVNLWLSVWNRDTNLVVPGSLQFPLAIEALAPTSSAEWAPGLYKKYAVIARGTQVVGPLTLEITIGARASTKPPPAKLGLGDDTVCVSKFKTTAFAARIESISGVVALPKGKLVAGKPILSDGP
jgi:hypothetical protein